MTGSMEQLILALATFIGGHFILSSIPVRQAIILKLSEGFFKGLYIVFASASFAWVLLAYGAAPVHDVWVPMAEPAKLVMPFMLIACVFLVAGLTTKSPTQVGAEAHLADHHPAQGIQSITRHPFLWAVVMWAIAHLLVNGDMATILLALGMIVLSLGGMRHIDYRRQQSMGAAWGPVALTTSVLPFKAIIERRCKLDLKGIGLFRLLGGCVLYAAFLITHQWIAGVSLIGIEF